MDTFRQVFCTARILQPVFVEYRAEVTQFTRIAMTSYTCHFLGQNSPRCTTISFQPLKNVLLFSSFLLLNHSVRVSLYSAEEQLMKPSTLLTMNKSPFLLGTQFCQFTINN